MIISNNGNYLCKNYDSCLESFVVDEVAHGFQIRAIGFIIAQETYKYPKMFYYKLPF